MNPLSGFASVRFSALGGRYEKFVTLCGQSGIPLRDIQPEPGGVSAVVPVRYYRKAAKAAKSCRTKLQTEKRKGIYFQLRRFKGRWGLILAPAVFCVSAALMGRMVWSVHWLGVELAQRPAVRQALYSMDICEGSILTPQKIRNCEKQLLTQLPELGWLSLNFGNGRLVIEAAPFRKQPEIEPNDPVNLVAKADGKILSMTVEEGIQQKRPGQTVAEGEVMVRAGREDRNGNLIRTHAKGTAIAQVQKTYEARQPIEIAAELPAGKPHVSRYLHIAGKTVPLQRNGQEAPADAKAVFHPVEVWGFALPATLEEKVWLEKSTKVEQLSEQAAQERARLACKTKLYQDFPGAKILEEKETMTCENGEWICRMDVTFAADILKMEV